MIETLAKFMFAFIFSILLTQEVVAHLALPLNQIIA